MKPRLLDAVLLAALVIVSGAIVWTLFSLGGGSDVVPAGDGGGDPAVVAPEGDDEDEDGNRVVPVAPDGDGSAANAGDANAGGEDAPADESDGADAAANGASADAGNDTQDETPAADEGDDDGDGDDEEAAASASEVGPVPTGEALPDASDAGPPPEGEVALERIGFSFVTGGAGACGVTLEPWEHVAVSRELLDAYGCGADITVTLDEEVGGRTSFQATVADTMNETFSRTVNVYVAEDEPAMAYGLTRGSLLSEE